MCSVIEQPGLLPSEAVLLCLLLQDHGLREIQLCVRFSVRIGLSFDGPVGTMLTTVAVGGAEEVALVQQTALLKRLDASIDHVFLVHDPEPDTTQQPHCNQGAC